MTITKETKMITITKSRYNYLNKISESALQQAIMCGDVTMQERNIMLGMVDYKVVDSEDRNRSITYKGVEIRYVLGSNHAYVGKRVYESILGAKQGITRRLNRQK